MTQILTILTNNTVKSIFHRNILVIIANFKILSGLNTTVLSIIHKWYDFSKIINNTSTYFAFLYQKKILKNLLKLI